MTHILKTTAATRAISLTALSAIVVLSPLAVMSANPAWDQATALYSAGDYTRALPAFRKLAEASPKDPSLHYMIGQCYKGLNKPQQAIAELNWVSQYSNDARTKAMADRVLGELGQKPAGGGGTASPSMPPRDFVNDSAAQTINLAARNGWTPCRGRCLNFGTSGWHHYHVDGHPDSDMWMTYKFGPAEEGRTQLYNQQHIGHIIKEFADQPAQDVGTCSQCNGTGWIKSK